MKTVTAIPEIPIRRAEATTHKIEVMRPIRSLLRRVDGLCAVLANGMRLVRAYNELRQLNDSTLRDLGHDRDELDRVLQGFPPRPSRSGP